MAKGFLYELEGEDRDRVEDLAKRAGVDMETIMNNALSFLEMAAMEVRENVPIVAFNKGTQRYVTLELPLLGAFAIANKGK